LLFILSELKLWITMWKVCGKIVDNSLPPPSKACPCSYFEKMMPEKRL